ncbi:YbjN domain-containing protein [Actinomyces sp. B33]|uniref:YbjN domain-containing protein n=1 Tax=Actinomyces sp. B33 TaxID=2942131 RepID=UPI0023420586|nr:YbjN domain-containing protein [Actinomyces sp. B33]MDC4233058.1 YbjN domain-containing protein [Actinomyces sp. B33]
MTTIDTPAVTLARVCQALTRIGIVPFTGGENQVAAILPGRVLRIIVPEGRPVQGVADYPRSFSPAHAEALEEAAGRLNATLYLPKVCVIRGDQGGPATVRLQHTFTWAAGASDAQVAAEVRQFVTASIGAMARLDEQFTDPWSKEAADA